MKSSVAILLGLVFLLKSLFPSVELSGIIELPVLLSHYQAHQAENPQITFLEFIHLHYDSDSSHIDDDAENHAKLPFSKRHHHTTSLQLQADLGRTFEWRSLNTSLHGMIEVVYFEIPSFQLIQFVWQPPRG